MFIDVPQAFTIDSLNMSRDVIAKQDNVECWPYLQDIKLPRQLKDAKVTLLIGINTQEALEPEEIRKGKNGSPYAIKTKFRWTLNGPLVRSGENGKQYFLSTTTSSDDLLSKQLRYLTTSLMIQLIIRK